MAGGGVGALLGGSSTSSSHPSETGAVGMTGFEGSCGDGVGDLTEGAADLIDGVADLAVPVVADLT